MAGQCLRSNQHEPDTTPGGSRRQEGLACSGPWGHEESDTTKRLNTHTFLRLPMDEPLLLGISYSGRGVTGQSGEADLRHSWLDWIFEPP